MAARSGLSSSALYSLRTRWRQLVPKIIYHRLEEKLDRKQAEDQLGFRLSFRIEEAIGINENVISATNEYNLPLWIASLDLRKAFDRIQYDALFAALREQGLDHAEVALLLDMYSSQSGSVGDSKAFQIERGVKQENSLSSLFFNAVTESIFRC